MVRGHSVHTCHSVPCVLGAPFISKSRCGSYCPADHIVRMYAVLFIKDAVNMDDVSFHTVHIKVLLNLNQEQLNAERSCSNVTDTEKKGCLHLIFRRDETQDIRDQTPNVLFDILNNESPFNKWVTLNVQALHLSNEVFSKHPPSLASEVQVKEFLSSLPLFENADWWWIFHIQDKDVLEHIDTQPLEDLQTLYCVSQVKGN
jgi:hypothetical protein